MESDITGVALESGVRRLCELVSVRKADGVDADWVVISERHGFGFPSDYREFIATFGAGSFEDAISVMAPRGVPGPPGVNTVCPVADEVRDDSSFWSWRDEDGRSWTERPAQVLLWGMSSDADMLGWLTSAEDPDQWPVVVWKHSRVHWMLYRCTMTRFLVRTVTAQFAERPVSPKGIWGVQSPRFLSTKEEVRLNMLGIDPWCDDAG
ncbi:SMI1/KNR4 family protein [Kitasatospora sp. RB6PN24]|uniref:SMI1/KNR4 family protein n=1 Tax=Kitasatospora humi TaxID=2893891 RepID=UPI001E3481BA|nr:SMI1/KNR4 family protein [Kitasatospora humi]MCC9307360.1 SMI1/KNR4 family protein [Kitasatospora humi]